MFIVRDSGVDVLSGMVCGVIDIVMLVCLQYFTNEQYEAECYDKLLSKYEEAALKTTTSLALLNWGQNAIFSAGLTVFMYLASQSIMEGW